MLASSSCQRLAVACALALVGCSSDPVPPGAGGGGTAGSGGGAGAGGEAGAGGAAGAGGGCAAIPEPSPSWLQGYQREVVGRLSGELEIAPGISLTDRASAENRGRARDYLFAELEAHGYSPELHDYGTGANVWAQLDASGSSAQHVLLGAHYDSVLGCPGANDNATGVALVAAVARYLPEVECRTVNVIVVLFDEEEGAAGPGTGRLGSQAFANMVATSGYGLTAAHTVDQMGWDDDNDRLVEVELPAPGLLEQYEASVVAGGFLIPLLETDTGGTDHVSFRDLGYAAVGLTEGYASGDTTPYIHTAADTYTTVDFDYLASTTALVNFHFARIVTGQADAGR